MEMTVVKELLILVRVYGYCESEIVVTRQNRSLFKFMLKQPESPEPNLGQRILAAIRNVLQRCEEVGEKVGYPGEGGERRFRAWINSDLLQDVLLWPSKNVAVGERFDLLLLSDEHHAIATIETKTPYRNASKKERNDFEKRLDGFPTLRTAYFTNGPEWERLDIVVSGAELRILERDQFDISKASPAFAERFFTPLRYKASDHQPVGQVYHVNRDNPFVQGTLSRLTADLEEIISESTLLFRQMFYGLREGKAGTQAQEVTKAVYSQWCGKSLRITPQLAAEHLIGVFKEEGFTARNITSTLFELGLDNEALPGVTESILSLAATRRSDPEVLIDCLWPVLGPSVDQLCAQTAHVLLARTLLYRVGEDEKVFARRLSGTELNKQLQSPTSTITGRKFPATELLESVRTEMQDFLKIVYLRGEFDWWAVPPEKRVSLTAPQRAWLRQFDEELEALCRLLLRRLSHYLFESVDVDIWRNIYEHYLPEDERQRLGGFYTPEELVNLVLDLEGYVSDRLGLCELSYIDPACGSGAFVTTALGRLIAHLATDMPCHKELAKKGEPDWRIAEQKLKLIAHRVHAIDLHPFASFLTTLNVLFMALPLYVTARKKDPDFTIDFHIFSADGLERPDKKAEDQMNMFIQMNSRIQLSAESYQRYRDIMDTKFDRVFGNPPWGGVLKGPLAPVYDTAKKKHFASVFRSAAKGKYDIYGLFMERALQLLKKGGRFALLTQDTYLDKEWAKGLRKLLSEQTALKVIVDLNPFGQLFFNAMNAPCLTIAENTEENVKGDCLCVTTTKPEDNLLRQMKTPQRRAKIAETVEQVVADLGEKRHTTRGFSHGARIPLSRLRTMAQDRWDLSGEAAPEDFPDRWLTAAELFETRQGVTPGGCLDIFLMEVKKAEMLGLESALVRRAIKTKQLESWHVEWKGQMLFYPYEPDEETAKPAFTVPWDEITDPKLKSILLQVGLDDVLDYDKQIDARESQIVRDSGVNNESAVKLLKHRISLGLVKYPVAAKYLTAHYERLQGRVFKKKNIREFNRRWYEYIWRRDPQIMLGTPRILSPRLVRHLKFVLDETGYLSDDACLMIQPTKKTKRTWSEFRRSMKSILGATVSEKALLQYCLAFMNTAYAQTRLLTHRPTPKGSYPITEAFLREIPIPKPSTPSIATKIIRLVTELEKEADRKNISALESKLERLVQDAMKAVESVK